MTALPATVGVEWMPISPLSRSICWSAPLMAPGLQIDDALVAERGDRLAGLRVQRDEPVAGRVIEDPLVAAAVGPVGDAASRELARRQAGALALAQAVRPDQLAGLRVERDHRASRAGRRVEHALHHQRRAFELELGERAEVVGLEPPGDLELAEVRAVDLIQRGVAAAGEIGGVVRPLAVLRARLPACRGLAGHGGRRPVNRGDRKGQRADERNPQHQRPIACDSHPDTPRCGDSTLISGPRGVRLTLAATRDSGLPPSRFALRRGRLWCGTSRSGWS